MNRLLYMPPSVALVFILGMGSGCAAHGANDDSTDDPVIAASEAKESELVAGGDENVADVSQADTRADVTINCPPIKVEFPVRLSWPKWHL
jgi:hypothetical protein